MSTEEMIEAVIQDGVDVYRHDYRNTKFGSRISRHEPVMIDGIEINYWRELAIYKTGKYLQQICPTVLVDIELDGNNSSIKIMINDDQDEKRIMNVLQNFLESIDAL